MKTTSFVCGVLTALAGLAALSAARRAQAAEPGSAAQVTVLNETRDTRFYVLKYQRHTCFIASAIGGSGLSLQCPE